MEVREFFWNTKVHLSFQSSSAAALIKKLSDGKFGKFFGTSGHSFWIRANCRWFGQRRVEKKSHRTASFKAIKLLTCHFLATGILLMQKFNFENLLDFNKKNTILRFQRIFLGNLCFFPFLWQNQDLTLSYVW